MNEPTYTRPDTVTEHECLQIIYGVVRGMGPVTKSDCAPIVQKAIDMLHEARTDSALIRLVMDGQLDIEGVNQEGEVVFRKAERG